MSVRVHDRKDGKTVYNGGKKAASGQLYPDARDAAAAQGLLYRHREGENGADPTWSIASATVTVYRSGALEILTGGESQDEVTLKNTISGGIDDRPVRSARMRAETIGGLTSAQAVADCAVS